MKTMSEVCHDVRFWWWRERKEKIFMWLAWRVPRPIAYWVFIRMASDTDQNPADRTCDEVLRQHESWVRK